MTKTNKFLDIIEKKSKEKGKDKFSGTFSDYLKLIEESEGISVLAHKRLYDAIKSRGVTRMTPEDPRCANLFNGEKLRTYDYFQSNFFGMERSLAKVMRYLHSAAMKGEESKQVLLLLGPVGAGKSALIDHVKRVLEATCAC
ncbi:MAG: hypothetical protein H8E74_01110 [Gammaproteobacteria bacterium]|nr:hypothetical protein [Gammaproteobacteria bacterium]